MVKYQSFIGLEVHIHLLTKSKAFCACTAAFGAEPNTHICPVCLGYPGVLPSLNMQALHMGALVARALHCSIPQRTWFERKQYFYPDMPKNYQISQFTSPLGSHGYVELETRGVKKRIRIRECHLEEDAGKMIHRGDVSFLDYNRAGVPLLEIVSEPDMENGEEAELFIRQLRRIVRYLGVCDGNMEEGSLRADANVSINLPGVGLGRKVEIKNLNSSRFVRLGLDYEIKRQQAVLDAGGTVIQETRLWNENRDQSEPMRSKENAHDYRYFPEPDLPVFLPDQAFLDTVDAAMVELPETRQKRLMDEYHLKDDQAEIICEEKSLADYFEATIKEACSLGMDAYDTASRAMLWLSTDIKRVLKHTDSDISSMDTFSFTPCRFAQLLLLLSSGRLTGKNGKQTLEYAVAEDKDPYLIVEEHGWEQITDPGLIARTVEKIISFEDEIILELGEALASGNERRSNTLLSFLVGKVLAATDGRAEPKLTRDILMKALTAKQS